MSAYEDELIHRLLLAAEAQDAQEMDGLTAGMTAEAKREAYSAALKASSALLRENTPFFSSQKTDAMNTAATKAGVGAVAILERAAVGDGEVGELEALKEAETAGALLTCAALWGQRALVERLLGAGAPVDWQDEYKRTGLYRAAEGGHLEVVRLFLGHSASVDLANKYGASPLLRAAGSGHAEVVRTLLEHGASVDLVDDYRDSPLLKAAMSGHTEVVRILLERRASVDRVNYIDSSPLLIAAENGHTEVVRILLEHRASVDLVNYIGSSPLWMAAQEKHAAVVKLLLDVNAEPNISNNIGFTPLDVSVWGRINKKVVELLCAAGADANVHSMNKPLPLVRARNNLEVAATLLLYGADPMAALKQMREKGIEEGSAVELIGRWPRISSLHVLCVRVVQRHRLSEGMPSLLLTMPDVEWEVEKEQMRRERGKKRKATTNFQSPGKKSK